MVAERVVLRRVQHLQQGRGGVAAVVRAELVHLVQQDDRVHRARLADGPDDPARQRAHVGTPVTTDLRLVPDAAQRDPGELTAHGAGHRLAERGLADPGRAGQSQHRAAAPPADQGQALVGPALAHRQVLDDPVLDVIQARVIRVEDLARARDVVGVVAALVPRDLQHRVQPGADPAALWRLVRGPLQLGRFLERGLAHLLGQVRGLDPGLVVLFLGARLAVQLGQFLADGGQLLAEQELALLLLHALADIVLDRLRDVQLGQLVPGPPGQQLEPLLRVDGLQQLLTLLQGQVAGVSGAVGQSRRVGDPLQHVHDLPRAPLLQDRGGQSAVLTGQFLGAGAGRRLVHHRALNPQGRAGARRAHPDPHAGQAADHGGGLTTREPPGLLDGTERAQRRVLAIQPGHEQHMRGGIRVARHRRGHLRGADRGARFRGGGVQRHHHGRQHHCVVQRQHRQGECFAHCSLPDNSDCGLRFNVC